MVPMISRSLQASAESADGSLPAGRRAPGAPGRGRPKPRPGAVLLIDRMVMTSPRDAVPAVSTAGPQGFSPNGYCFGSVSTLLDLPRPCFDSVFTLLRVCSTCLDSASQQVQQGPRVGERGDRRARSRAAPRDQRGQLGPGPLDPLGQRVLPGARPAVGGGVVQPGRDGQRV